MTTIDNDRVLSHLLALSNKIASVAAQEPDKQRLDGLIKDVRQVLIDIDTKGKLGDGRLMPLQQALENVILRIERLYGNGESGSSPIKDMDNGYIDLDVFAACLNLGSLTVVAGATDVGKTAFALQVAAHAASIDFDTCKSSVIFSMRQSGRVIAERLLSNLSMLEIHKLRSGEFDDSDWNRFTYGLGLAYGSDGWIYDSGSIGIDGLQTLCRVKISEVGALGLVIIDDLQCIQDTNPDEILRALKALAMELSVPIVAISNLCEPVVKGDDGPPRLSNLENRDAILRTADMVLLIHRDKNRLSASKKLSHAEVIVALHKGGHTGTVPFLFDNKNLRFMNRNMLFQLHDGITTCEQWEYENWISAFGGLSVMH